MLINLDLSAHCIETEIRRRYNQSLSAYFKAKALERGPLEQAIELLQLSLENLDFPRLRARYPELAGGTDQAIALSFENNTLMIRTPSNVYERAVAPLAKGRGETT